MFAIEVVVPRLRVVGVVFSVASPVHVLALGLALRLHLLNDLLHHLSLLLGLDLLQHLQENTWRGLEVLIALAILYLVKSLHLLLRLELPVCPDHSGRVSVGDVALVALLTLEEHLALLTLEQADVVDLPDVNCKDIKW